MSIKKITLVFLIVAAQVFAVAPVLAAPEKTGPNKTAIVDWREALLNSKQGNAFRKQIERELGKDQKKLQRLKQSLITLQDRIKKDKDTLGEKELNKLTMQFRDELGQYEQLSTGLNQKRAKMEEDFIKSSEPKIIKAIEAISKEQGYNLILDRQAALHFDDNLDLTTELKKRLDKNG